MLRAVIAVFVLVSSASVDAMTVDELVAKHIEARGGIAQLRALQSLRLTGKLVFTGDSPVELQFVQLIKREGRIRVEASLQGLTAIQAWDGKEGWQVSPFSGRKDPERMSPDDAKELVDNADLDGPLVDWQSKGSRAEYVGTEDVDGTEAHKLRLTGKNGDVQTIYLDPDYFLVIRVHYQRSVRGVQVETETDYGNYERINGVLVPFSRESGRPGGVKNQKVVIARAEPNVPVDDSVFAFPGARTK